MTRAAAMRGEVSALHPALPGHFPGNPVVPGVLILDRVCRALTRERGGAVKAIPVVKFHSPLGPGEPFEVEFESAAEGRYRFRVVRRGELVASGAVEVAPHAPGRQ